MVVTLGFINPRPGRLPDPPSGRRVPAGHMVEYLQTIHGLQILRFGRDRPPLAPTPGPPKLRRLA